MGESRIAGLLFSLLLLTTLRTCLAEEGSSRPLALGFGQGERFVLYNDGGVYKLGSNQTSRLSKIDLTGEDVESAIVDFEVYGGNLYLYLYRSLSASSGETTIIVYDLSSGGKTFRKTYGFTVAQANGSSRVIGSMVLAASACSQAFAVITANTTHSLIEVFRQESGGFWEEALYSGRMAMSIYRFNDTLIAAAFKVEVRDNVTWATPRIMDIVKGRVLFELPALTPVAMLAYLFIQAFNTRGSWFCHATVYNPLMNRMEYYIVYPEKQGLIDSTEMMVSPYMDYLVMSQGTGSKIMFENGENLTFPQRLSVIPQGAYVPLNPGNGVLDADPGGKAFLAKTVEGGNAKILYVTEKSTLEVYSLNASKASKTEGFYAVLVQDMVYMVNPENHQLVMLKTGGESEENPPTMTIALILAVCIAFTLTVTALILYRRRCAPKTFISTLRG